MIHPFLGFVSGLGIRGIGTAVFLDEFGILDAQAGVAGAGQELRQGLGLAGGLVNRGGNLDGVIIHGFNLANAVQVKSRRTRHVQQTGPREDHIRSGDRVAGSKLGILAQVEGEFGEIRINFPLLSQPWDDGVKITGADINQRIVGVDMNEEVGGFTRIGRVKRHHVINIHGNHQCVAIGRSRGCRGSFSGGNRGGSGGRSRGSGGGGLGWSLRCSGGRGSRCGSRGAGCQHAGQKYNQHQIRKNTVQLHNSSLESKKIIWRLSSQTRQ